MDAHEIFVARGVTLRSLSRTQRTFYQAARAIGFLPWNIDCIKYSLRIEYKRAPVRSLHRQSESYAPDTVATWWSLLPGEESTDHAGTWYEYCLEGPDGLPDHH